MFLKTDSAFDSYFILILILRIRRGSGFYLSHNFIRMENKKDKFILGIKRGMTQLFLNNGEAVPVTIVEAGPCQIAQVKTKVNDGYQAVQLSYGKKQKLSKPLQGHLKGLLYNRYLAEFIVSDEELLNKCKRGLEIRVDSFKEGDLVKVVGISKGKGFQGVVKRHKFHGSPASHGHKDQLRMPGSIGAGGVQHVFKGTKMGGRMGHDQVTVTNLQIVKIDEANNLFYIKGALPGIRGGMLKISGQGDLILHEPVAAKEKVEENKNSSAPELEDNNNKNTEAANDNTTANQVTESAKTVVENKAENLEKTDK